MKILVTGASGGMGPLIIEELLRKEVEVVATSRSEERLKKYPFFDRITFVPYDLEQRSAEDLFQTFKKPDSIIHLAWDKLKDHKSPLHTTTILEDHKAFIGNLLGNGLKDCNVIGTVYEYGLREGELQESDPAAPVIAYAEGKNNLRIFIEDLRQKYTFSFKWIRVFNVFSPGKEGGNLYAHVNNAIKSGQTEFNMSGGEQIRDYMTGEEVSSTIVKIALQKKVTGIINCASGKPVKLKDFIQGFLDANGSTMKLNLGFYPYLPHEPMSHWGSTDKLNRII